MPCSYATANAGRSGKKSARDPALSFMFHYASLRLPILVLDAESENFLEFVRTFENRLELMRTVWILLESAGRVVYGTVKPVQVFCI